jgi:hypothetical protein
MKPKEFIVRLWVDVHVTAKTMAEAKDYAKSRQVQVEVTGAEIYDWQVGDAWESNPS